MSATSSRFAEHALVIGGSMAGLMAARVLSTHVERVTLVERDSFDDSPTPRKGVPQGRHLHGLLKRGTDILEELFPGLHTTLLNAGAVSCEFCHDVHWYHFGGWKMDCGAGKGISSIFLTRPLLELEVRRRVLALGNVQILDGHEVKSLLSDGRRVTGAMLRRNGTSEETQQKADLVVDASGRGSAIMHWLEGIGRSRPEESTVKVKVGYTSRIWRRPPEGTYPWKALYIIGGPKEKHRLGAVMPIEGERWISVVAGQLEDYPPDDYEGMLAFARGLPVPHLANVLAKAEPLGDIITYRFPSHQRRHFDRMKDFPEGLVVLGDAACSLNPIYGQGIATAALGAMTLGECISERRWKGQSIEGLSRHFQQALAKVSDLPWMMSTGEDFRAPGVQGKRPLGFPVLSWYTAQIHKAVHRDPVVLSAFLRVMNMVAPLEDLLRPEIALRAISAAQKPVPSRDAPFAAV